MTPRTPDPLVWDESGDPTRPRSVSRWGGLFAWNLGAAMGMGIFALMCIAAFAPAVVEELALSRAQLGSLVTVAFTTAAVVSGPVSRLVGRINGRTSMFGVFTIGGLAAAMMASAQTLAWLWGAALLCGIVQALANVITNQLVADHVPKGQQGIQVGIKQSGPPLAQAFIGFVLVPAAFLGWRGALLSGAAIGALGVIVTWRVVPRIARAAVDRHSGRVQIDGRMVRRLTIYSFTAALVIQPVLTYVPLYGYQRVGLTASVAGMATGVLGISGIIARIVWGRVTEVRQDPMRTLAIITGLSFGAVMLILGAQYVGAWALWAGVLVFGCSAMAATAVIMLTVVRLAGSQGTGRASGTVARGLFLGGLGGPIAFGALVDQTQSYPLGWGAVGMALLIQGGLAILWRRSA